MTPAVNDASVHALDLGVLAGYVLVVLALGLWTGREEKNEEDYFLGGRSMPWWAVALSFYATTASALTFIGVPGAAFKGDFVYLQLAVGDLLGRFLIGYYLLPAYFGAGVTTVYQLLGQRFGAGSEALGTVLFLITRVLASGVRLAACAIAFSVIFQTPLVPTIGAVTLVAMIYTTAGGIKAVIWTDTLQFALFMGGAVAVLGIIWSGLPDGVSTFLSDGAAAGKFTVFHLGWDFNDSTNFVPGTIFGCLLTLAVQGTDQDMVQRLLTTKTLRESQGALFTTALMNIPVTLLFLSVGASLFVHYQHFPDAQVVAYLDQGHADYVFPHFMLTALKPGVRGLLMAGLLAAAMSSLDSALNALSSTAYVDLWRKYISPEDGPEQALWKSRMLSLVFAVILMGVAVIFGQMDGVLWVGFRVMGYTYGTLLGLFLVAVWTPDRGSDGGNLLAVVVSILAVVWATGAPEAGGLGIAWPWSIVIGTGLTFVVGAAFPTPLVAVVEEAPPGDLPSGK